jgi:hypothetical protein
MRHSDARPVVLAILWLAAVAARLAVGPQVVDDAYITMRYSRNLAATGDLVYNPPDAVLGTSTPLWTGILALADRAGVAPPRAAVVVSTLADLGSIALLVGAAASLSFAAIGAAAAIAAWPAYVAYAVSGMETSLYVFLIIATATALHARRLPLAGALAGATLLCRPEGLLVVVVAIAAAAADGHGQTRAADEHGQTRTRGTRQRLQSAGATAVAAAAVAGPWVLFALWRYGSVMPASISAKAAATDPWWTSLNNVGAYFLHGMYLPLTIFAAAGAIALWRSGQTIWRVWAAWGAGYLGAMTAVNAFTHFPWYFVPLLPLYVGAAAHGGRLLGERIGALHAWTSGPVARRVLFACAMVGVLLSRMPALKAHLEAGAAGREQLYASVAADLARLDPACTVAATEIGAIGYYYPGRILDLVGLVSPEAIGRSVPEVLDRGGARWLVTYDTHLDRRVVGTAAFTEMFERRRVVPVGPNRSLEIYERRAGWSCR